MIWETKLYFYLGTLSGENLIFKYSNIDGDLSDEKKSITLAPYAAKYPKKSGRMNSSINRSGKGSQCFK